MSLPDGATSADQQQLVGVAMIDGVMRWRAELS
jgi:hypothetical protein